MTRRLSRGLPSRSSDGAESTQAPRRLGLDPRGRSWVARWVGKDPEPGERRCEEKSLHLWRERKKGGSPRNQTTPDSGT